MNYDFCGIEKFSLVDYDKKVTCTLFSEGCNFRCPFCHNSSLVLEKNERLSNKVVFDYLEKRKKLLDAVCFSGGEPTLNPNLKDNMRHAKYLGYLVKLDTNGTNPRLIRELVEERLIDYVAMDIKNSKESYGKTVGIPNYDLTLVSESVKYIMSCGVDYEFRTTLVADFHSKEDIMQIGDWLSGAKKYILQHFKDGEACIQKGLSPVNKETAEEYKMILEQTIKNVSLRGY
jgi:pyruvate formate lyase activating enzyme